jgi:hypothetical protein
MTNKDSHYRIELVNSLTYLMGLNFEASCELLKKVKDIESNRELINSLSEIIDSYF